MSKRWEPYFGDWAENDIVLHPNEQSTFSGAREEVGVTFVGSPDDFEDGAAIFCIDENRIYLRLDWGNWFPVSTTDRVTCLELSLRRNAILYFHTDENLTTRTIPVFHVDKLPKNLFRSEGDI